MDKIELKKKAFIEKLKNNLGNISKTCTACNISRSTFYNWKESDSAFSESIEEIDEFTLDTVEDSLLKQIKDGNTTATIFFLKTKGAKRGYIEKFQTDITSMGKALENNVNPIEIMANIERVLNGGEIPKS